MRYEVDVENAATLKAWADGARGIAYWTSINLSDPGRTAYTPAYTREGEPVQKPGWWASNTPTLLNAERVFVVERREVRRFRVALRRGAQGLMVKLTDASTRKLNKALDKAGEGARYHFDYDTQEAVITLPTGSGIPLSEWRP